MESFAILWSESESAPQAGKLVFEPASLRFEGHGLVHRVYYEDVESVWIARSNGDRLAGRPAIVLELAVGGPLRIGSLDGIGVLSELAERLGHLTATPLAV